MSEMHDDERIYHDMVGAVSDDELRQVRKVINAWATATERLDLHHVNLRITFLACMFTLEAMGPAYCKLGAANLMARANDKR